MGVILLGNISSDPLSLVQIKVYQDNVSLNLSFCIIDSYLSRINQPQAYLYRFGELLISLQWSVSKNKNRYIFTLGLQI